MTHARPTPANRWRNHVFGTGPTAGSTFWARLAALGVIAVIVGVIAMTASACHAVITASENCSGLVSYTVTAWNGSPRSNDDVSVQANGTQLASGAFNSSNGYSFSGTYQAPSTGSVTITASGLGKWYDTGKPSESDTTKTSVQVSRTGNCTATQTTPTTTTTPTRTTTPTTTTTPGRTTTPTTTTTPVRPATSTTTTTPGRTTTPTTTTTPATTSTTTTTPATTTTTPATTTSAPPTTTTVPAAVTTPAERPGLALRKTERVSDSKPYVISLEASPGETVHYRMVVTNTGNTTMTIAFLDLRCDDGTLVAHGSRILAPGATTEYTCSHVLVASDGPMYVNTATVSGVSASGATAGPVNSRSITQFPVVTNVLGASKTLAARASKKPAVKPVTKTAKPAVAKVAAATFTG